MTVRLILPEGLFKTDKLRILDEYVKRVGDSEVRKDSEQQRIEVENELKTEQEILIEIYGECDFLCIMII